MERRLNYDFFMEFLEGNLAGILNMVHNDTTLIMELRGNKVVIYYRGGALFTITYTGKGYEIYHNPAYWIPEKKYEELVTNPSPEECVKNVALYKHQMDYYRSINPELEAQCLQQLVLENNILPGKSKTTGDYFILDIEYAYKEQGGLNLRFDAIGLNWPSTSSDRRKRIDMGITFFEMKYYDGAMKGKAGIQKHISDYMAFREIKAYFDMCRDMEGVFWQKYHLGLIPAYMMPTNLDDKDANIIIDENKVDFAFLFANRDPDSTIAKAELSAAIEKYGKEKTQDIYVANASDVGYVLFRYKDNGKGQGKADRYIRIADYVNL